MLLYHLLIYVPTGKYIVCYLFSFSITLFFIRVNMDTLITVNRCDNSVHSPAKFPHSRRNIDSSWSKIENVDFYN